MTNGASGPPGIDDRTPRLSWQVRAAPSARGIRQAAFQVVVATTVEQVRAGQGDVWDSGRVSSRDPWTIYAGPPPTQDQALQVAASAFILSPVIGGFFAAGAAWYRRFLRLSAPVRTRPSNDKKSKPGDGRTRTTGTSQKAGARR